MTRQTQLEIQNRSSIRKLQEFVGNSFARFGRTEVAHRTLEQANATVSRIKDALNKLVDSLNGHISK